jgi:signal transduction histidine kinase
LTGGAPVTDADRAAALADAKAETERLGRLVEDLLELARADAAPELAPVPLAELLAQLPADHVTIGPELAGAVIPGDRASLLAMLRNLTDNAERYADGWSLAATRDGETIALRVIDHGPGIRLEERTRVFERFARGAAAGGTSGSGIGLAIVAAVVRAHRGEVAIADTPGGGATFVLRLPLRD